MLPITAVKRREREKRQRKEEVMRDQKHKAEHYNLVISYCSSANKTWFFAHSCYRFFYKFNFLFYIQTSSPKEHPTIDHCGAITYYMTLPCLGQHYAFLFSSFISLWILNTKKIFIYLFVDGKLLHFCAIDFHGCILEW